MGRRPNPPANPLELRKLAVRAEADRQELRALLLAHPEQATAETTELIRLLDAQAKLAIRFAEWLEAGKSAEAFLENLENLAADA